MRTSAANGLRLRATMLSMPCRTRRQPDAALCRLADRSWSEAPQIIVARSMRVLRNRGKCAGVARSGNKNACWVDARRRSARQLSGKMVAALARADGVRLPCRTGAVHAAGLRKV